MLKRNPPNGLARQLSRGFLLVIANCLPALGESLDANVSTAHSAVVHFDRADYFVYNRYGPHTPTRSARDLETAIFFNQGTFLEPDSNGYLDLPADFGDRVAFTRAASPDAKLTLGLFSLYHIVGKPVAISNFIAQLEDLIETYDFSGVDIDWEDMPNTATFVTPADYGATVKAVSDALRPQGIIISTSHAQGGHYEPYAEAVRDVIDFLNLQFYFAQHNAMDMPTFRSRLAAYVNRGLRASQIRVGLPSYGMTHQTVNPPNNDRWRSWNHMRNAGVDLVNANQWTDPSNSQTYYFSGLNLIQAKIDYAMANGFAGVFTWELTQDTDYDHALSINRRIDELAARVPVIELNDTNNGGGALGTGAVHLGSGSVLNNGILRFARSGTHIYGNVILGNGRVETTAGTTILTGANSFVGGTTVGTGSALHLGNGGSGGSVVGPIEVEGTLTLNRADNLTLPNPLSGSGRFVKAGAGVLALDGSEIPQTFSRIGITGGTLAITGDMTFSGHVIVGDGVAGTIEQSAGTVTLTTPDAGWGAGVNIGHRIGGDGTYHLTGGRLDVLEATTLLSAGGNARGTLRISGTAAANLLGLGFGTSPSGVTTVALDGGRLNLGEGGMANLGEASGARTIELAAGVVGALADWSCALPMTVLDDDTGVTFDTTGTENLDACVITLVGPISGPGKVSITGTGELHLDGGNTYSGGTIVTSGTLRIGNVDGSATGSGPVTVVAGTIAGSGAIAGELGIEEGGTLALPAVGMLATGPAVIWGTYRFPARSAAGPAAAHENLVIESGSVFEIVAPDDGWHDPVYLIARYHGTGPGAFSQVLGMPDGYQLSYDYEIGSDSHVALVAEPFTAWRLEHNVADPEMDHDSDGDGVPNGIEFVLGGDPLSNSRPLLPVMVPNEEDGGHLFVFRRTSESAAYPVWVELSDDLETWLPADERIPDLESRIDVDFHGPGVDRVTVMIPEEPGEGTRLFARLAVGTL